MEIAKWSGVGGPVLPLGISFSEKLKRCFES